MSDKSPGPKAYIFQNGLPMCHLCNLPSALDNCPDCDTPTPQPAYALALHGVPEISDRNVGSPPVAIDEIKAIPDPRLAELYEQWVGKRVKVIRKNKPILQGKVIGVDTCHQYTNTEGEYLHVRLDHCENTYGDQVIPVSISEVEQL